MQIISLNAVKNSKLMCDLKFTKPLQIQIRYRTLKITSDIVSLAWEFWIWNIRRSSTKTYVDRTILF